MATTRTAAATARTTLRRSRRFITALGVTFAALGVAGLTFAALAFVGASLATTCTLACVVATASVVKDLTDDDDGE